MIKTLRSVLTGTAALAFIFTAAAQAPTLGTAANFALFTTTGSVTNTGISQITGDVGSNNGPVTGFGNVNGTMHSADAATVQCATDLFVAYTQLDNAVPTGSPAPALGNGQTLFEGVYSITGATTIGGILTLDAQNDASAVFIFKVQGTLSSGAATKVRLINGAQACNVFWKVEGAVNLASGTFMRGTIVANNAAIHLAVGDTLEGRALSTAGAVLVEDAMVYTPIGCGSPTLTGPVAPQLGGTACYALFSSDGDVANTGTTVVKGDIGSNTSAPTGYNAALVDGTIHMTPDGSTAQCASDLLVVYNYLNTLPYDIELLYPAQFGNGLVLTPHTYLMNAAVTLTDTVYLNAQDNPDAVFVIQVNGAFSTSVNANIVLQNGAQSKNVFWKIEGAMNIASNSVFRGTIICNNAAFENSGVELDGRALVKTGALSTNTTEVTATEIPANCGELSIGEQTEENNVLSVYPNPFSTSVTLELKDASLVNNCELIVCNVLGEQQLKHAITAQTTTLATAEFPAGVYYYTLIGANGVVQSGKLIVQ